MHASEQDILFSALVAIGTFIILIGFFVMLLVIYQRKMRERQRDLFQSIIDTEERERERIARDLHDELGPLLSVVKMKLEQFKSINNSYEEILQHTNESQELLNSAIQELRNTSKNLLPGAIVNYGLRSAIEEMCATINLSSTLHIELHFAKDMDLPKSVELNIYRILKEIINNTIKHAKAKNLKIDFSDYGKLVSIKTQDDGTGFDTDQFKIENKKGIGLKNIESRIAILGGDYKILSAPGKGTKFEIEINLK
jgi:two-component system, NarL family, sensor kinase